ncbi:Ribonuclease 3 [Bienertia sinuspersici]
MLQNEWPSFTCPQIGRKFWLQEWNKHGTCTKSALDEMSYFHATLNLHNNINILEVLAKANIKPNNQFYPLKMITTVITQATRFKPFIFCNNDAQGYAQIWQVAHCVDKNGIDLINCNNPLKGPQSCASSIKFPSY